MTGGTKGVGKEIADPMAMRADHDRNDGVGRYLHIGTLLYDDVDQIDVTGPFEVLSRLPNATHRLYAPTHLLVRDIKGLRIHADATIAEAPQVDVLHVPGGPGQEALMDDKVVLEWLRSQAAGATAVLSVCTGALLLGAAGLIVGRRATTHWAAHDLLPWFGAVPVNERVVRDGVYMFTAGVTAGIDGALRLAAELRGQTAAEFIQLYIAYAPERPFNSGTPETAPAAVLKAARHANEDLAARRLATAQRIGAALGISAPSEVRE
jgi:cyclohexyl-isocyanide hydratase